MRYLRHAALLIAAGILLSGATCSQMISEQTGTTLEERCDGYRTTLTTLDIIRSERELSADEASRRSIYGALVNTYCPPLQPES